MEFIFEEFLVLGDGLSFLRLTFELFLFDFFSVGLLFEFLLGPSAYSWLFLIESTEFC